MKKFKYVFWIIFSIAAGIILTSFVWNPSFKPERQAATAVEAQAPAPAPDLPEYHYIGKNPETGPPVSAQAYLVGDLDTGEVILSKNENDKYPIASVSKLMTAYVSEELDKGKPDDTLTISQTALNTYGQNGNFRLGEKLKVSDILYPLRLESSNDAAEALAEHFGRDSFLQKMNQLAADLGMTETSFEDPSGLSAGNDSSVSDLFKLAGYIYQKADGIFKITLNRSYSAKGQNWFSIDQFLNDPGYLGGKSGFTNPAKETVVSLFALPLSETGTRNIAITLLQSADRHKDVENIVSYLEKNFYYGGTADAAKTWVALRSGAPAISQPDSVDLVFGGDIMLDGGVRASVNKNFGGDYSKLFDNLGLLKKADIAFANLEGPASDIGQDRHNLYSFRMDPAAIPALSGAGFSVLSVANNHMGDWGRDAYADTLDNLAENEILAAGGGMNKTQAEQPEIVEKYGLKIGYLAFSDVGPDWMAATATQPGILLASDPDYSEIIAAAAKQVDFLVVSIHFGVEYEKTHTARQETLAHAAIDAGAKLVIGSHPHVPEDTEVYKNGFIAYSLGNLIFDQGFSKDTMHGMLLEVKLNRDGSMSVQKDLVPLSPQFQPEKVVQGKEEKVTFVSSH